MLTYILVYILIGLLALGFVLLFFVFRFARNQKMRIDLLLDDAMGQDERANIIAVLIKRTKELKQTSDTLTKALTAVDDKLIANTETDEKHRSDTKRMLSTLQDDINRLDSATADALARLTEQTDKTAAKQQKLEGRFEAATPEGIEQLIARVDDIEKRLSKLEAIARYVPDYNGPAARLNDDDEPEPLYRSVKDV